MQSSWASNFASSSERQRWDGKLGSIEINGQICLKERSMPEGHVRNRTNHGKKLWSAGATNEGLPDQGLGDAQELMNRGALAAKCSGFPVVCGECIVTG